MDAQSVPWGTIALITTVGVAGYMVLGSASAAASSAADLAEETRGQTSAESCNDVAIDAANAAVESKSWWKSKTTVFDEAYATAYDTCLSNS